MNWLHFGAVAQQSVCDYEKIFGWLMNEIDARAASLKNLIILLHRFSMHTTDGRFRMRIEIENLKDEINALVYDFYATPPDKDKLSNWVQLLQGLVEYDSNIEIFTTNYDRVLEQVPLM